MTDQTPRPLPDPDSVGFYLTSTDRDLLQRVEDLMRKRGLLGVTDLQGRIHYLVDGRRGSPYAARRIEELILHLSREQRQQLQCARRASLTSVDQVLARFPFRIYLKGYRFLRQLLQLVALDPTLMMPVTKRLYPAVARTFKVSPQTIERDLRYLFNCLKKDEAAAAGQGTAGPWLTVDRESTANTAMINLLYDLVMQQMQASDQPQD